MNSFRSLFCKHDPRVLITTATPPRELMGAHAPAAFVERVSAGVTTVLVACNKCGQVRTFEMLGAVVAA